MSPTILRQRGFRVFFFSREELRPHVHILHAEGTAKFWLEPTIALAHNHGLSETRLRSAEWMIREHEREIRAAWQKYFGR